MKKLFVCFFIMSCILSIFFACSKNEKSDVDDANILTALKLAQNPDFQFVIDNAGSFRQELLAITVATIGTREQNMAKGKSLVFKAFVDKSKDFHELLQNNITIKKYRPIQLALMKTFPSINKLSKTEFISLFTQAKKLYFQQKNFKKAYARVLGPKSDSCQNSCDSAYAGDLDYVDAQLEYRLQLCEETFNACVAQAGNNSTQFNNCYKIN